MPFVSVDRGQTVARLTRLSATNRQMIAGRDKPRPIFYNVHIYLFLLFSIVCMFSSFTNSDSVFITNKFRYFIQDAHPW